MPAELDSFIDEKFLKQLEKLKLITQKGVKGPFRGEHKSWRSGEGQEFLDYRNYQAGDDLRYVDWSVYGRFDKLLVKLFHAEENQTIHFLMDTSRSMRFGSPSKLIGAKRIAAAVSYIGLSNLDRITMAAFADTLTDFKPPVRGKRRYAEVLNFLHLLKADKPTNINKSLSEYATVGKYPGIILVLSDLFDPAGCQDGLKALSYRNFDVHLIQVLDREELFWTKTGSLALTDIESEEKKVSFVDRDLAKRYQKRVNDFLAEIKGFCDSNAINHYVYDTSIPFEDFLIEYLTKGAIFR
ncbi:MAG: DUF58 domain-containing protein [bacterium]|nr:DUF58 domain-containing protein [bacterium]